MEYDFLNHFEKRMQHVGMYALLNYNSFYKDTLRNYGFDPLYEGTNIVFSILIFIMEKSLKEEDCTIDHISEFVFDINRKYFLKEINRDGAKEIADFMVNTLLGNKGEPMYFSCFNFQKGEYEEVSISYLNNKTIYVDNIRRTSYYLTEEGYHFLLGTLEIESNLKLTVQEFIFKLHLDKADYTKAIDDVKGLFNISRIQLQRIEESIRKIKENVLSFSAENYDSILKDNLEIIKKQKDSFQNYRQYVEARQKEIYDSNITMESIKDNEEALEKLNIIKKYLSKVIYEQQRIIHSHFDFKMVYSNALLDMTAFSVIKRINIKRDLYEPILRDITKIKALPKILRPLFIGNLDKVYNIAKAAEKQRVIKQDEDVTEEVYDFDEVSFKEEREAKLRLKKEKYKGVLETVLFELLKTKDQTLTLEALLKQSEELSNKSKLVPTIEIFREVMIELLKVGNINIEELRTEAKQSVRENSIEIFELNKTLLRLIDTYESFKEIKRIEISKDLRDKKLTIYGTKTEEGIVKTVQCSNIIFKLNQ
ncbi:hypothetical protein [Alkaliphilus transvaalensis]|uniref:hypothetical protein n=1 Tax=Alkaliphilus transvaalensis TaxID=114628 RepID=UPI00047CEBB5|nr:hypothetical protein [Alkaliphilus transvaalensis]